LTLSLPAPDQITLPGANRSLAFSQLMKLTKDLNRFAMSFVGKTSFARQLKFNKF